MLPTPPESEKAVASGTSIVLEQLQEDGWPNTLIDGAPSSSSRTRSNAFVHPRYSSTPIEDARPQSSHTNHSRGGRSFRAVIPATPSPEPLPEITFGVPKINNSPSTTKRFLGDDSNCITKPAPLLRPDTARHNVAAFSPHTTALDGTLSDPIEPAPAQELDQLFPQLSIMTMVPPATRMIRKTPSPAARSSESEVARLLAENAALREAASRLQRKRTRTSTDTSSSGCGHHQLPAIHEVFNTAAAFTGWAPARLSAPTKDHSERPHIRYSRRSVRPRMTEEARSNLQSQLRQQYGVPALQEFRRCVYHGQLVCAMMPTLSSSMAIMLTCL